MGEFFEISVLVKTKDSSTLGKIREIIESKFTQGSDNSQATKNDPFKNHRIVIDFYSEYEDFSMFIISIENLKLNKQNYISLVKRLQIF